MAVRTSLLTNSRDVSLFIEKVVVSKEKLTAFANLLSKELADALQARESFDEKLIKWNRQYEAVPDSDTKSFPWKNASNVVAPLTAIATDAIEARIEGELVAKPEMVVAKSLRGDEMADIAEPLERYLNHAARQENDLDTENCLRDVIPDTALNGISFIKCPYVLETENVPEFDDKTGKVKYRELVTHDGPKHLWVSVADVLWPEGTNNIQQCRWFAQRFYLEWWQIKQRVNNPSFGYDSEACNRIKINLEENIPKDVKDIYDHTGFTYNPTKRGEFYEVYIISDIEKIDDFQQYIVTIHPESREIVRFIKHFYAHKKRPYVPFFYTKRRKTLVAQGVGGMLERLQDGVTTSLNQMIDNSTAANTIVLKVKKGSGIKANEEIYPMKKLMMEETTDVEQFRLGENAQGMSGTINILRDYAERRSGVTDYQLGMESTTVGTRSTAAGTMSLIQEGNKQIDRHIRLFKQQLNELWAMTIVTYQQFSPERKIVGLLSPDDAAKVEEVFKFPPEWFFDKIAVTVSEATSSSNKEIEKQNMMTLFNMLMGYYQKIVDVSVLYQQVPPMVKLAIDKSITAMNELLEKILRHYDQYDIEHFIIQLDELAQQAAQMQAQQPQPGGPQNGGGVPNQPGGAGAPQRPIPGQGGGRPPVPMGAAPPGNGGARMP